jgi:hypothetical protein
VLKRLLQLVAEGGVHSYATLAGQLGVSTGLLEQMLQDLARMRYIVPLGGACDTSQCHHCPLGGSCATDARGNVWVLTDKGMQAAGGNHRGTGPSSG